MHLRHLFFITSTFLFFACGESETPTNAEKKNAEVAGTCTDPSINITIDDVQNTMTAHLLNTRNECSVDGDVFTFTGEKMERDLVFDYQFVGDTLILAARGEGYQEIVLVGGKNGNLSARWKVLPGYRFINGSIVKEDEESATSPDHFDISENCLLLEDNSFTDWDYTESRMTAWIYDQLFFRYKFIHLSNAYGDELFTRGSDQIASAKEQYGITVLEKTRTSETIEAFGQTVSIRYTNIQRDTRNYIFGSYEATVEANGNSCNYTYFYMSEVTEEFCKAEYKDYIEVKDNKAVRVNRDDTETFGTCLSKLLP
jgi:hypothetical protein